ncbi:hypothetical protein LP419_03520 [Massilia sp. H-1]|nr:hypothetical protein LP419_03520 [Massilia sp. H-1]
MKRRILLMTQASLPERHLHIGRLLLADTAPEALESEVFVIVGHLNRARAAIDEAPELARLAGLNLMAGARARRSAAFDAARHYHDQAAGLTPDSAWQEQIEATFALHSELAECEYLCGNLDRAGRLFAQLAAHARSRLALARVALMRVALYQVSGRFDLAAAVALEALELFGISFPDEAGAIAESLAAEQAAVQRHMAGRSIAELEQESPSGDPELAIVGELLSDMGSSVFSARPELYPLLAVKALNFTLRFGSTATSCMTYSLRDHAGVAGRHSRRIRVFRTGAAAGRATAASQLRLRLSSPSCTRPMCIAGASRSTPAWRCWNRPMAPAWKRATCRMPATRPTSPCGTALRLGAPLDEVQQRAAPPGLRAPAEQRRADAAAALLRTTDPVPAGRHRRRRQLRRRAFLRRLRAGADGQGQLRRGARFHLMRQIAAFTFGRYGEALQAAGSGLRRPALLPGLGQ